MAYMAEEDQSNDQQTGGKPLTKAEIKRRQIKEVKTKLGNLSPTAAAGVMEQVVANQARKQVSGFTDFLREQSVVGVGIGLVFGIQIKAVVDTVMLSFINPLTELLPGGQSLATRSATLVDRPGGDDV